TSVALFVPSTDSNDLLCAFCAGAESSTIELTRMPVGERISGWAFAHRRVVVNSDASLDLGPVARTFSTPLRYALVAPLHEGKRVFGVLTLYGTEMFGKDHTRMLESAADLFTASISEQSASETSTIKPQVVEPRQKVH